MLTGITVKLLKNMKVPCGVGRGEKSALLSKTLNPQEELDGIKICEANIPPMSMCKSRKPSDSREHKISNTPNIAEVKHLFQGYDRS